MKLAVLAGKLGPGISLGDSDGEIFGFSLGQPFQVGRKPGEGKHVGLLGHVVNALVIDHFFPVNGPLNVQVQQVPVLHRTFHGFPKRDFLPQPLNNVVNLFFSDFHRRTLNAQALVVAEIHDWLKGHHRLEGDGFNFVELHLRFDEGLQALVPQDLVEGLRNHKLQRLLQQGGAPYVILDNGAGGFPFPETGDCQAPHRPAIGAVNERFFVLGIHFDSEGDFYRGIRFSGNLHQ